MLARMKTRIALIIVIVVALGLGIGLYTVKQQSEEQHKEFTEKIGVFSNQLISAESKVTEQTQKSHALEETVKARGEDISKLSNDLLQATENFTKSEASLKLAREETAKREAKIAELETQNEVLDRQAGDLKSNIGKLEGQIADTQKLLAASEGDKAFLEKELNRLMAEKAELERQFNDLAVLKEQVRKLKEEISVARRLEWIRQGVFAMGEQKGSQRLMQTPSTQASRTTPNPNAYDLNVEVKSDGSVQVIPPISTNAPPPAPSPAK
jgi:chromosome segregation ATPase